MTQPPIDTAVHLQRILEAVDELMVFHPQTAAPAPIPHQFIGTVVDNAVGLLTAPANALDGGARAVRFSDIANWLSLMKAVHRSFFSSLHLAIESGLVALCREREVVVYNRFYKSAIEAVAQIEREAGSSKTVQRAVKTLHTYLKRQHTRFDDYLHAVLDPISLPRETKTQWRRFFRALSIVRNKASHSDVSLTGIERKALLDGGCGVMISSSGELVINPRVYAQFVTFALQFFDLVLDTAYLSEPKKTASVCK